MIQTATGQAANYAAAIAAQSNINAIFIGGHVSQPSWLLTDETLGAAHVGRISLTTQMW